MIPGYFLPLWSVVLPSPPLPLDPSHSISSVSHPHHIMHAHAGIILISLALCADAVIGNVQEKALKKHGGSSVEMVLYSYSIGIAYILALMLVSGSFLPAFRYCLEVIKGDFSN